MFVIIPSAWVRSLLFDPYLAIPIPTSLLTCALLEMVWVVMLGASSWLMPDLMIRL
jgi:hypothetical protein